MKINTSHYETFFLLYIDNELSVEQKAEVELFIKDNPIYQKEFSVLQQTILAPDALEYEDKALLYRFEEMEVSLPTNFKQNLYRKETPIVKGFFTNKRILSLTAIAAILFLIIGFNFMNTNSSKIVKLNSINTNFIASNTNRMVASNVTKLNTQKIKIVQQKAVTNIAFKENTTQSSHNTPSFIIESPKTETINNSNDVLASTTQVERQNTILTNINEEVNNTSTETKANETAETYTNIDTEEHERAIYIANFEIDGDKLRGLTRRVNAFFRRNKTDKEK